MFDLPLFAFSTCSPSDYYERKRNQPKAQNANKQTKIKNAPKNIWVEKSNLFAYLRFFVFCAREEKKIENKKMKSLYNVMY